MSTYYCPECGHDQFTLDTFGYDSEKRLKVEHATCSGCGQQTRVTHL